MCPGLGAQEEKHPFEKLTDAGLARARRVRGEVSGGQVSESREEGLGVSEFQAGGRVKSLDPKSQGWARGQIETGRDLALLQGCSWAPC